jgi:HTH-type transcriptional regulator, glycine betaine synthesis regulator
MTIGRSEASDSGNDEAAIRTNASGRPDDSVRQFVEHWGMMARSWGINATMGELFALLYINGDEWTADALKEWLDVSRGNVSMNLRELMSWGVVHKVHRQGERREFYRAETDVWTLFRRILFERKRRELDPTLVVLERTVELVESESAPHAARLERIASLRRFFDLINNLATRLLTLEPDELDALLQLFDSTDDSPPLA